MFGLRSMRNIMALELALSRMAREASVSSGTERIQVSSVEEAEALMATGAITGCAILNPQTCEIEYRDCLGDSSDVGGR